LSPPPPDCRLGKPRRKRVRPHFRLLFIRPLPRGTTSAIAGYRALSRLCTGSWQNGMDAAAAETSLFTPSTTKL
ncbi:MAG: hypothetical protein ACKPJJ_02940, partial [Planctomycetaceae bacterium]